MYGYHGNHRLTALTLLAILLVAQAILRAQNPLQAILSVPDLYRDSAVTRSHRFTVRAAPTKPPSQATRRLL